MPLANLKPHDNRLIKCCCTVHAAKLLLLIITEVKPNSRQCKQGQRIYVPKYILLLKMFVKQRAFTHFSYFAPLHHFPTRVFTLFSTESNRIHWSSPTCPRHILGERWLRTTSQKTYGLSSTMRFSTSQLSKTSIPVAKRVRTRFLPTTSISKAIQSHPNTSSIYH